MGDTNSIRDIGEINGMDTNSDNKNAHTKADFNFYNIAGANTNADAGDTTGTEDASGISNANNNIDNNNAYTKAGFNNYNIAGANANVGMGVGDINDKSEEVSNNTNNTGEDYLGRIGATDKGKMGRTNIKVGVGVRESDKSDVSRTDIEAGKKASVGAITSTDNSTDGSGKIINQYTGFGTLTFAALTTVNFADNSNLAILERTPLGAATSTTNEFLATFATFANITLEKEQICKFNTFLFAINHQ